MRLPSMAKPPAGESTGATPAGGTAAWMTAADSWRAAQAASSPRRSLRRSAVESVASGVFIGFLISHVWFSWQRRHPAFIQIAPAKRSLELLPGNRVVSIQGFHRAQAFVVVEIVMSVHLGGPGDASADEVVDVV